MNTAIIEFRNSADKARVSQSVEAILNILEAVSIAIAEPPLMLVVRHDKNESALLQKRL